jgi:uncharacterized protein
VPARPSRIPLLAALLGIVAVIALLVRPEAVRAEPVAPPPDAVVQVDGVGTATGTPDVLRVTAGVEVTAEAVVEALQEADAAARRLLDALGAEDVAEADVQTVNLSVQPSYSDDGQEIAAYTARHDLEVTLRDLGRAGEVIGVLTDVGGDAVRLQGLAYVLEDDAALREEARADAFAAARLGADQYARLAGRELGDVIEVREQLTPPGPVPFAAADSGAAETMSVALAPGSATVTVTVAVHWSLR